MLIYKITHMNSGKSYIGLTTRKTVYQRYREHFYVAKRHHNKKGSPHKFKDILHEENYDKSKFNVTILDTASTLIELIEKEAYYIKKYDTVNSGFNVVNGGSDTVHREAVSKGLIKYWANVDETKRQERIDILKHMISENKENYVNRAKSLAIKNCLPIKLILYGNEHTFQSLYSNNGLKKFCDINNINFYDCKQKAKGTIEQDHEIKCYFLDINGNEIKFNTTRKKFEKSKYTKTKYKSYTLLSPNNKKTVITNLKQFCHEHSLCIKNIYGILNGKEKSHKGWKIYNA
jgi:hypothetical protein